jgi:carboxyl-terminal processing protease
METVRHETTPKQPQKKRRRRRWPWILWLISLALTAALTYWITIRSGNAENVALREALDIIRENFYFYDKDNDRLIESAIDGMTYSLDDIYSTYYTEEEYAALTKSNSGYYTGIGIVVRQLETGVFEIESVYPDTPAEDAGILEGDLLLAINDTAAEGLDLSTFLDAMHSEDGAENTLLLERNGERLSATVTAREIYAPTVSYRMQTDTIGYIYLSGFHGHCVDEVKDAIEELKEQGMQSLIFDVRDNPGGSLYDVCDIADLFLDKDLVITSLRSRTEKDEVFKTKAAGHTFPMVLLVNGDSASASELLSGALQDHNRAHLIGTQTYGKGIVQSYIPVLATNGYIKITTEAYYTPNGVCIHGVGITPDEVVENPEEASHYLIGKIPEGMDLQLSAAIRYLAENAN